MVTHHTVLAHVSLVDILNATPAVVATGPTRVMHIVNLLIRSVLSRIHPVNLHIIVITVFRIKVVSSRRAYVQVLQSHFRVDLGGLSLLDLAVFPSLSLSCFPRINFLVRICASNFKQIFLKILLHI